MESWECAKIKTQFSVDVCGHVREEAWTFTSTVPAAGSDHWHEGEDPENAYEYEETRCGGWDRGWGQAVPRKTVLEGLQHGTLSVQCRVKAWGAPTFVRQAPPHASTATDPEYFMELGRVLYEDHCHTDAVFVAEDQQIPVHRLILVARSAEGR